jgi:hypothetical protein
MYYYNLNSGVNITKWCELKEIITPNWMLHEDEMTFKTSSDLDEIDYFISNLLSRVKGVGLSYCNHYSFSYENEKLKESMMLFGKKLFFETMINLDDFERYKNELFSLCHIDAFGFIDKTFHSNDLAYLNFSTFLEKLDYTVYRREHTALSIIGITYNIYKSGFYHLGFLGNRGTVDFMPFIHELHEKIKNSRLELLFI